MESKPAQVIRISKLNKLDLDFVDKNVLNLRELIHVGINQPEGFLITPKAFGQFLTENNLQVKINKLLSTVHFERADSLMQISNHIKKLITESKMPDDLTTKIEAEYKELGGIFKKAKVSIGESKDSIGGIENIIVKIKQAFASNFEPKNLLAKRAHLDDIFQASNAIIIQRIIDSDKSGKLFTSNLDIETQTKLNSKQVNMLHSLASKLKKHFYLAQVAEWVLDKDVIYIRNIKPVTNAQKSYLVLVRHGESVWNAKDLWTGWTNVELSEKGHSQAQEDGEKLKDIHFDTAFTSDLIRAQQTLEEILKVKRQQAISTFSSSALNERNYGDLTGKNKWEIKKEFGDKQFLKWRRGFDETIPNGETLKDVYNRVVPYYKDEILPKLKSGKNVLIAAHGNSLRALVKYLENVSDDDDIEKLEIPVGQILVYQIDEDGNVLSKEIRN